MNHDRTIQRSPKLHRRVGMGIAWLCVVISCAGILLRLTVRDAKMPLAALYYATPLPVIAGLAVMAAVLLRGTSRDRLRRSAILVSVSAVAWWFATGWYWNKRLETSVTASTAPVRVLFWNTAHGTLGWARLADTVAGYEADIITLVEAETDNPDVLAIWSERFPDHDCRSLEHGMLVMSRFPIVASGRKRIGGRSRYSQADIAIDDRILSLIVVDIVSDPLMHRDDAFIRLRRLLKTLDDRRPVIVVGDMNTPSDSVHLRDLRSDFRNAFESAGRGANVTWPSPLPVLDLDQIWVNRTIAVEDCQLGWSWKSDHRPVLMDVRF